MKTNTSCTSGLTAWLENTRVSLPLKGVEARFDVRGDLVALRFRAAGQHDFTEDLGKLGAFMNDDTADAAGSDDEDSVGHDEK